MKIESYNSNEIGLEFKVWAPTFNRVTHRLYLLGSLKELGAWAIDAALEAFPTTDLHIWSVQAAVPPMSRFEWVWLKINVKNKKVAWERPVKRNRTVGCFSGVLHSVWGEHEEVFLQSAANVEVTTFKKVEDGFVMVLTGGAPNVGNWDLQRAVVASEFPNKSGYWKANFSFDANTNLNFKWAVVKDKAHNDVLVQEKVPHHMYGRPTWMRVAAPWMTTSTVVVDLLPLDEKPDNKMGRTDILVRNRMKRLAEIRSWMAQSRESALFEVTHPYPSNASIRSDRSTSQAGSQQQFSLDPVVTASLKKLWVDKQGDEHREQARRPTIQLHKDYRKSPQVFALKGVGQSQMPTDFANAGCFHWSDLVPEGERRVLEQRTRGPVSLWSLSMGLVKRSLQQPPGEHAQADTGKADPCHVLAGPQASGDGAMAEDSTKVTPELLPYTHSTLENDPAQRRPLTEDVGDGNNKFRVEREHHGEVVLMEEELVKPERRRSPKTPSLMLCEVDDTSDVESGKSPQDYSCVENKYPAETVPEELGHMEKAVDALEFFKSLEISHSKEILAASESKVKPCGSGILIGGNSLSSFCPDVYASMSSDESTLNETDALSVMDDTNNEKQNLDLNGEEQDCISRSLVSTLEMDDDIVICSLSGERLEDEGFSERGQASESAPRHKWGEMRIASLLEDEAEDCETFEPRPAYWKVLHHSREMSLPLLVADQRKTKPKISDIHSLSSHKQAPTPSALKVNDERRDTTACQNVLQYAKDFTYPETSTTEGTLGHLYQQYEKSGCWKCWARGEELFGEFDVSGKDSLKEDSHILQSGYLDASDFDELSTAADVDTSMTTNLISDDPETLLCELSSSKNPLTTFNEPNFVKQPKCGPDNAKKEGGDAANCGGDTFDNVHGCTTSSADTDFTALLEVPCEDLNIFERRLVAQALELEWGCGSAKPDSEENSTRSCPETTKREPFINITTQSTIHTSLFPPRRGYKTARYSLSEFNCIVTSGPQVDRRAMARQAEKIWGQAGSSRRH